MHCIEGRREVILDNGHELKKKDQKASRDRSWLTSPLADISPFFPIYSSLYLYIWKNMNGPIVVYETNGECKVGDSIPIQKKKRKYNAESV